jgi:O-antigen ligase
VGDDRFHAYLTQFSFFTVTSIRTHIQVCPRAAAPRPFSCQFPFAGIAILLTRSAPYGPYNESAISTPHVEMAERAPLSSLNPLRTPLTTASHLQPAEKSTSTPIRWGYLLAEMALIVLFTYLVFFATPHSGLYTPLTLGITAALFTLFTIFYLFKAAPADPRLAYPVLAAVAVLILTSLTSIDPRRSIAESWLIAMPFFLGFVLLEFGRRGLPGELVVKSLLVPGGLVMLMSWAQALFWYRSWLADFPGEWIPSISYRLPAPNFLAVMFNLLLMLALARLLASASRLSRLILALYCLSALGLLFLTSSRGGWIGTAAGLFCLFLLLLRFQRARLLPLWNRLRASPLFRSRLLLAAALLLALAVLSAVGYLLYRQAVHPTHAPALGSRGYLWQPALTAFLENPLLGRGPHTYASFFMRQHSVPPNALLDYAHNIYLDVLASSGLLGLAPFGWLLFSLLRTLWRRLATPDPLQSGVVTGACAALAAFLVHGLFDSVHHSAPTGLWTLAIILSAALITDSSTKGDSSPSPITPSLPITSSLITLLGLLIVSFSYLNLYRIIPQYNGVQAANRSNYSSAALLLEEAARRDPRMAPIHAQLGLVYSRLDDLDRAIASFQTSLALDPDWAPNHANLGLLYRRAGSLPAARDAFTAAAARAPAFYLYHLYLGEVDEALGHPEAAQLAYTRALELNPGLASSDGWGLSPLHPIPPSPDPHDPATHPPITALQAQLASNPAQVWSHLALADAYIASGRLDEAERLLLRAHRLVTVIDEHYAIRQREADLAAARGDAASVARIRLEIASTLQQPGVSGPGTGVSSYIPYVFRRAGLSFEVVYSD